MARWSEWLMIGQSGFLNDKAYWVVSLCIHCSISSIDSFKVSIGSFKTGVAQRPILARWLVWVNAQNRIGTAVACILVSMTAVACVLVQIRLNGRYWLGGQGQCSKWNRGHRLVQICMLSNKIKPEWSRWHLLKSDMYMVMIKGIPSSCPCEATSRCIGALMIIR